MQLSYLGITEAMILESKILILQQPQNCKHTARVCSGFRETVRKYLRENRNQLTDRNGLSSGIVASDVPNAHS
jgi:hypothetical protein